MAKRVTLSKAMLQVLNSHEKRKFRYILTGDESWFEYYYGNQRMWIYNIDQRQDMVNQRIEKKIMVILFFNGEGPQLIQIKPSGLKINAECFINNVIKKLEVFDVTLSAKNKRNKWSSIMIMQ